MRHITFIDIFGRPISLRINKMDSSKTFLGGILTVMFIIAMFSMLMMQIPDVLNHKFPNGNLETKTIPNPSIIINSTKIPFSFYISDDYKVISWKNLSSYFQLKVKLEIVNNSNAQFKRQDIPFENCTKKHFPLLKDDEFYNAGVEKHFCLTLQDYPLFGALVQPEIQYLGINLYPCNNSTSNNTCKSTQQIEELLLSKVYYFNVILQNEIINIMEYKPYSSVYLNTIYKSIRGDRIRQLKVFLSESELISDNGLLFQDVENDKTVIYDRFEFDEANLTKDKCYFSFEFYPSKTKYIYHREYLKLPTVLASLGGLSNIIQIVCTIAASFYSTLKRNEHILNKIFEYDVIDMKKNSEGQKILEKIKKNMNIDINTMNNRPNVIPKKIPNNLRKISIDNSVNKSKSPNLNDSHHVSNNHSKYLEELLPTEKNQTYIRDILKFVDILHKKTLEFTFFEMVKYIICRCCVKKKIIEKFKLYQKSSLVLNEALDITHIIGKLEELEKLKIVLFNKHQLALFHFISKYLVSNNTNNESSSHITNLYALNNDKEALVKLLFQFKLKYKNENFISPLDHKLFSFLADDLKIIFGTRKYKDETNY
jgi:hypothetical protein